MIIIRLLAIISLVLLASPNISLADKALSLKVNVDSDSPIKKNLLNLAKEMEAMAKIYHSVNQRAYWESEGKKSFYKLLHSQGYYSSEINTEITHNKTHSIIFHISLRERYKISHIFIKHTKESNKDVVIPDRDELSVKKGQFAIAGNILDEQNEISDLIENRNCLLSLKISHDAIIDEVHKLVKVTFFVNAGQQATIGELEFDDLKDIKNEYVQKLISLKRGQCFRSSYIDKARQDLQKTGLFASTTPTIPDKTNKDGSVPVTFHLIERKRRSVKTGFEYRTDLGFGATLGWENRNLFGSGEDLRIDLFGNRQEQMLETNYIEQFFIRNDQTLKLSSKLDNKKSKAFDSYEASISALIDRKISKHWNIGAGGRLSRSIVRESKDKDREHFTLISTPLYVIHDTRDNIFSPQKGYDVKLEAAPYLEVQSHNKYFLKTKLLASTYFTLPSSSRHVLAMRAGVGSILGINSLDDIPHVERFYIGGSNSLRGYAYQFAGKLNKNNRPIGGRSFLETSVELRIGITDHIGIVGFLDSGRSYNAIFPNSKQKLLQGSGVGLRYITSMGPIRADIGFPLKRRKGIDQPFQIYFGIGQAF
ncbi:BamA/TamA family outer membrane protein [Rickettsiaceae bacterium]|nr:BamA/TamA family outer membrane protein [Rickettsiaceae bacterium]